MKKLLHCIVMLFGGFSLYWTDLTSVSMFYGGMLPLFDIVFLVYLSLLIGHFFVKRGADQGLSSGLEMGSTVYSNNEEYSSVGSDTGDCGSGSDAGDCGGGGGGE